MLKFTQHHRLVHLFPEESVDSLTLSDPRQVVSACCLRDVSVESVGLDTLWVLAAPSLSLTASWGLWSSLGAEGSPETGWGDR